MVRAAWIEMVLGRAHGWLETLAGANDTEAKRQKGEAMKWDPSDSFPETRQWNGDEPDPYPEGRPEDLHVPSFCDLCAEDILYAVTHPTFGTFCSRTCLAAADAAAHPENEPCPYCGDLPTAVGCRCDRYPDPEVPV